MKLSKVDSADMQAINSGHSGKWKKIVIDFIDSEMSAAEVKDFDCKAVCAYQRIRTAIRNHNYPVKAIMRKGRVFIIREEPQVES